MFLARKWYGGDWWFVLISALLLLFVITVGIFPSWFAPHDPREEVGPSLLAPGEPPSPFVLIAPLDSGINELRDVADRENNLGYIVGTPANQALREALAVIIEEDDVRYQPRPRRFETFEEGFDALVAGEVDAFIATPDEMETYADQVPADRCSWPVAGGMSVAGSSWGPTRLARISSAASSGVRESP